MVLFVKYFSNIIINVHNNPTEVDAVLLTRKQVLQIQHLVPKSHLPSLLKSFRANRKSRKIFNDTEFVSLSWGKQIHC